MYIYIYIYIYVCVYICIYIYIYVAGFCLLNAICAYAILFSMLLKLLTVSHWITAFFLLPVS